MIFECYSFPNMLAAVYCDMTGKAAISDMKKLGTITGMHMGNSKGK